MEHIALECVLRKYYSWQYEYKYLLDKECNICLESMKDHYVLILPCNHIDHAECILTAIHKYKFRKCPDCQKKFLNI